MNENSSAYCGGGKDRTAEVAGSRPYFELNLRDVRIHSEEKKLTSMGGAEGTARVFAHESR